MIEARPVLEHQRRRTGGRAEHQQRRRSAAADGIRGGALDDPGRAEHQRAVRSQQRRMLDDWRRTGSTAEDWRTGGGGALRGLTLDD